MANTAITIILFRLIQLRETHTQSILWLLNVYGYSMYYGIFRKLSTKGKDWFANKFVEDLLNILKSLLHMLSANFSKSVYTPWSRLWYQYIIWLNRWDMNIGFLGSFYVPERSKWPRASILEDRGKSFENISDILSLLKQDAFYGEESHNS